MHQSAMNTHISVAFNVKPFLRIGNSTGSAWYGSPGVYVLGTRRPIAEGLRMCLAHYHLAVKGRVRSDEELDYVDWVGTDQSQET